eukprot:156687-Hanusia_phi.AAC.1
MAACSRSWCHVNSSISVKQVNLQISVLAPLFLNWTRFRCSITRQSTSQLPLDAGVVQGEALRVRCWRDPARTVQRVPRACSVGDNHASENKHRQGHLSKSGGTGFNPTLSTNADMINRVANEVGRDLTR